MKNKVFIARTDDLNDDTVFMRLYHAVSSETRSKIDNLSFRKDKMLSLATEILLKIALNSIGITEYTIKHSDEGKPYLTNNEIHFSLSHSEETVMCAISETEIGADVEKVSDIDMKIAKRFFHPAEYELMTKLHTDTEMRDLFFRLWTLKESFLKAVGLGLLLPLDSFQIEIKDSDISLRQNINEEQYYFKEYLLNDGYRYSVCSLSPEFEDNVSVVNVVFGNIL